MVKGTKRKIKTKKAVVIKKPQPRPLYATNKKTR